MGIVEQKIMKQRKEYYEMIRLFSKEFEKINGSIVCRDLLGHDLKQEGARKYATINVEIYIILYLIFF